MASDTPICWGILGTGNIARKFTLASQQVPGVSNVLAAASRSNESATRFQQELGLSKSYASYDSILTDPDIEGIYIALPNHLHAEWALKAAQHGKHILCEKPLTVNAAEAEQLLTQIAKLDICFVEGFLYRFHPQTKLLYELLQNNRIGKVQVIQADFCFNIGLQYQNIRLSNACAGGSIMDVGCYTVSMARLLAGATANQPFLNPVKVDGSAHIDPTCGVDLWASSLFTFENGLISSINCSTQCKSENKLRILGSEGSILVSNPWKPTKQETLQIVSNDGDIETLSVTASDEMMGLQLKQMHAYIRSGQNEASSPAMSWADSLGNMQALDAWRKAIGLGFPNDAVVV